MSHTWAMWIPQFMALLEKINEIQNSIIRDWFVLFKRNLIATGKTLLALATSGPTCTASFLYLTQKFDWFCKIHTVWNFWTLTDNPSGQNYPSSSANCEFLENGCWIIILDFNLHILKRIFGNKIKLWLQNVVQGEQFLFAVNHI